MNENAKTDDEPFALSMGEFVTLTAFLMAITALSVDVMLPVLPSIVEAFALGDPNQQQFMVTVYLGAFAFGHIFVGPLSDRYGRKPALLGGLLVYIVGAVLAIFAESYTMLLIARAVQGFGAAGPRVVAVAIVRDRFVGRAMSQVMSFIMTVFIILPVIAPTIGATIGSIGTWRHVFLLLLLFAIGTFVWTLIRMPETNPRSGPDAREPVAISVAVKTIWSNGQTVGYMVALGFIFGCLMTYISTTQQLFADIYGIVDWFPLVFASVAGMMIVSSFTNSHLVRTMGMRRLSHGACIALMVSSALMWAGVELFGTPPLAVLMVFLSLAFFLIGLVLPNFNALAMEPLGRIAGTGSSFVGFIMTGLGAFLGGLVGQLYDGTVYPLLGGFFVYSAMVVVIVYFAEGRKLMQPSAAHPAE